MAQAEKVGDRRASERRYFACRDRTVRLSVRPASLPALYALERPIKTRRFWQRTTDRCHGAPIGKRFLFPVESLTQEVTRVMHIIRRFSFSLLVRKRSVASGYGHLCGFAALPDLCRVVRAAGCLRSAPTIRFSQTHDKRGTSRQQDSFRDRRPIWRCVYKALQTAVTALLPKLYDVRYNFEVLENPDAGGFLLYALAATTRRDEILTSVHYRITESLCHRMVSKGERFDFAFAAH